MRGDDRQQVAMFSYILPEAPAPKDHPLRPLRLMVDVALAALSPEFDALYSRAARPSGVPPMVPWPEAWASIASGTSDRSPIPAHKPGDVLVQSTFCQGVCLVAGDRRR